MFARSHQKSAQQEAQLVEEMTSVLHEWNDLWKKLYIVSIRYLCPGTLEAYLLLLAFPSGVATADSPHTSVVHFIFPRSYLLHHIQTLHLLSLLSPVCPPSPPTNTSSVFPVFFSLAAAPPAPFYPRIHNPDVSHNSTISALTLTFCPNLSTFNVPLKR